VPVRDPEKAELDRRQFINRGVLGGTALGLGIFGAAALAFAYPRAGGGFGGKVNARTTPQDAKAYYETNGKPLYSGEGRFYVVPFIYTDENQAKNTYPITFEQSKAAGVMVLYQKCAHLGCRVPFCDASKWFECPCHGSQYNMLGERQKGPAPRGLSRFRFTVGQSGEMVVDTGTPVDAPGRGPNTPGLPESPNHCVAG
jgi:cytochrome b6-f complex iron-sulfur subunit